MVGRCPVVIHPRLLRPPEDFRSESELLYHEAAPISRAGGLRNGLQMGCRSRRWRLAERHRVDEMAHLDNRDLHSHIDGMMAAVSESSASSMQRSSTCTASTVMTSNTSWKRFRSLSARMSPSTAPTGRKSYDPRRLRPHGEGDRHRRAVSDDPRSTSSRPEPSS